MDFETLKKEILELKQDTIVYYVKKALLPLSLVSLLWMIFVKRSGKIDKKKVRSKKAINDEEEVVYNLQNLRLPRLFGWKLKLFSRLGASAFGRLFIVPSSQKQSNLHIFRSMCIPEKPTLYPIVPAKVKAVDANDGKSEIDIWSLVKESDKLTDRFQFTTISDLIHAYRSGKCSPVDVANRVISAIEATNAMNPSMRIIIQSNKGEILEMASLSADRYKNNAPLSVFDGIPVTAKDEFRIGGYKCYDGTSFLGEEFETEETEATIVNKLRKGGAVIIGVANMHQLGMGTTGCNGSSIHGTCRNPYNPDYFCGGSSSGSGAAVAAGLAPMALGVDGGGSVRIPASACGVVGVKGSFGRLSSAGVYQFSDTVGYAGPLCPTVRDAAISYAFMAGPDPLFPPSLEQSPVDLKDFENTILDGVKIGIDWTYFNHGDQEVVQTCTQAVKFLENECQAEVKDITIPELEETRVAHFITIISEMNAYGTKMRAVHYDELMQDSQVGFSLGDSVSALDYFMAQKQRTRSMMAFEKIFKDVDCIITPTLPMTMMKVEPGSCKTGLLDADFTGKCIRYMFHGNLIGVPCITVPVGYGENNMPIGLQVMTKWWDEAMMFRVGHAAEKFLKTKKKPQVHFEVL